MPKLKIDATALDYKFFIIPGQTGWTDATKVQELELPPGGYNYQIASGFFCDFAFSVGESGLIDYDPKFATFLDGAGTDTLKLNGLPVTIDARYMPGLGVIWCGDIPSSEWMLLRQCRLLPASYYRFQQGSGIVCDFSVRLDGEGLFQYDAPLDHSQGGPLRGQNTSTLELLGFPILVDARQAGGTGLLLQPIGWGVPFATTSVVMFNLLPAKYFQLQLESGIVTQAGFDLGISGEVTLRQESPEVLKVNKFHGMTRVTAHKMLPKPV